MNEFSSAAYWDARYRAGGTSGAGSAGWLARYKAAVVNGFIAANGIRSMIDAGCGNASQLSLLIPPAGYTGVDVSSAALARCATRHPGRRFVTPDALPAIPPAELTLSMDVLYHLIEDEVFAGTMHTLFAWSTRYVMIYSSNIDAAWPAAHVRHRCFTDHIARTQPAWRLLAFLPNPRPFDPARPEETSFADFYIFGKRGGGATIPVPEETAV